MPPAALGLSSGGSFATLPADVSAVPSVGDVIAGKYVIERELGAGGMGVVLAARHRELDTQVAIKLMRGEVLDDPQASGRFLREARAAARLRGEHIARVTDYGKLDSGEPYSVIEYLEGKDLSDVLEEGPLPVAHAVEYICQACEALIEAHGHGIVHRDIKPSNLFLIKTPSGKACVKVLDFGISKFTLAGEDSVELAKTSTQAVLGSPLYMSPEQMRSSRTVDARSDVWSLGATLYQLLTRRVPFAAETMMELCMMVANDDPPPLRGFRPEIQAPLEAIVLRCLRRSPDDRFQTVSALQAALAPYAAPGRASAADIVVRVPSLPGADGAPPSSLVPDAPTQNSSGNETETAPIGPQLAVTEQTWGKTQGRSSTEPRRRTWVWGVVATGLVATGLGLSLASARAPASTAEPVAAGAPEVASEPSVSPVAAVDRPPEVAAHDPATTTADAATPAPSATAVAGPSSAPLVVRPPAPRPAIPAAPKPPQPLPSPSQPRKPSVDDPMANPL